MKRENIDRIVVAMGERRGQLPTNKLLQLSLAGNVSIEEGASFYERITGRVSLEHDPSFVANLFGTWRQARFSRLTRSVVHRLVALIGAILVAADRHPYGDSDQAGFARAGLLQAGTRGQQRAHVCADEVSLDAC